MRITSIRVATETDAVAISDLINEHEFSVDPANSSMSPEGALDFMAGYIDASKTYLLSIDDESGFSAIVNLHPDSVKGRFFADIYAKPTQKNIENLVLWSIELAQAEHPDWQIWPGANYLDTRLQSAWAAHGFKFLRRYYTMRISAPKAQPVNEIPNLAIRAIDISDPTEFATWHAVHQNSFAKHFGFAPRTLESWKKLALADRFIDANGVFMAFKNGEPVGYCQSNDEYAQEGKGYIVGLGVRHENQGEGIGRALLQTGINYCIAKGYQTVELNVDTGNESGALRLYEGVGFRPESSWIQMHNPSREE